MNGDNNYYNNYNGYPRQPYAAPYAPAPAGPVYAPPVPAPQYQPAPQPPAPQPQYQPPYFTQPDLRGAPHYLPPPPQPVYTAPQVQYPPVQHAPVQPAHPAPEPVYTPAYVQPRPAMPAQYIPAPPIPVQYAPAPYMPAPQFYAPPAPYYNAPLYQAAGALPRQQAPRKNWPWVLNLLLTLFTAIAFIGFIQLLAEFMDGIVYYTDMYSSGYAGLSSSSVFAAIQIVILTMLCLLALILHWVLFGKNIKNNPVALSIIAAFNTMIQIYLGYLLMVVYIFLLIYGAY